MSSVSVYNLLALGAAPASGDLIPIVDIDDPTQSPHGSLVKMTVANLFTAPTFTGTTSAATVAVSVLLTAPEIDIAGFLTVVRSTTPVGLTNSAAAGTNGFLSLIRGVTQVGLIAADVNDDFAIVKGDGSTVAVTVGHTTGLLTAKAAFAVTGDVTVTTGNVVAATAGKGLTIKAGSNARIGTGTLASGSVAVANTSVTSNTTAILTATSVSNQGFWRASYTNGVGFTVASSNGADASSFQYVLVEST